MVNKYIKITDKFKFFILIPAVILVVGIIMSIVVGPELDINFKGGSTVTYTYTGELDTEKADDVVTNALAVKSERTVLTFTYTGSIDSDAIESAALNSVKDRTFTRIAFSAADDNKSFSISTTGAEFLTDANAKAVEDALNAAFEGNEITLSGKTDTSEKLDVNITTSKGYASETTNLVITVVGNKSIATDQVEAITADLIESFADNSISDQPNVTSVDASVGASFFAKSLYALGIASVLVVIYVGIRFRKIGGIAAALTALIALIHDVAIVYCFNVIFGITINDQFIAVILTILGYSLNDTIVIYDRVRENTALYGSKMTSRELVDRSVSQCLKRTIVTTVTTFVAITCVTVVAAIFGLTSILTFSIPMSIGIIAGSFSSNIVAGPLYVFWLEFKEKHNIGKKTTVKKAKKTTKKKKSNKVIKY